MTGKLKIDDRKWRAIQAAVQRMGGSFVSVGVLADQGGSETIGGLTLVEIARLHEFGNPATGLEERSFLRATLAAHEAEIRAFQAKLVGAILLGKLTEARALDLLGAMVAGLVKKFIYSGQVQPELAESTIKAKGSSTPLVDTSALVNHITHEVVSL